MASNPDSDQPANQANLVSRGTYILALAGAVFIYGSVAAFGAVAVRLMRETGVGRGALLNSYIPELIIVAIGVFGALLGVMLLRSVGLASAEPNRVINREEWDVIHDKVKAGDEKAIDQYIRLTSLTGFTGAFTKLGLTGLPMATIALTLFFSVLAISYPVFMDLAKLTLGAFIGSFVQKQATGSQGSVTLPGGQTVAVRPAPPV